MIRDKKEHWSRGGRHRHFIGQAFFPSLPCMENLLREAKKRHLDQMPEPRCWALLAQRSKGAAALLCPVSKAQPSNPRQRAHIGRCFWDLQPDILSIVEGRKRGLASKSRTLPSSSTPSSPQWPNTTSLLTENTPCPSHAPSLPFLVKKSLRYLNSLSAHHGFFKLCIPSHCWRSRPDRPTEPRRLQRAETRL